MVKMNRVTQFMDHNMADEIVRQKKQFVVQGYDPIGRATPPAGVLQANLCFCIVEIK